MEKIGNEVTTRTQASQSGLLQLEQYMPYFDSIQQNRHIHRLSLLPVQSLNKLIALNEYYKMILDIPGSICEFGVNYGSSLATWVNLRNMYEPFNASRTVHGFDTFSGFPAVTNEDRNNRVGDYSTVEGHESILENVLTLHESFSPQCHLKKFFLHKGDVSETVPRYINDNPHTIIALAYFDLDLYVPTRDVLLSILPRLTKGSLIIFDELNCPQFPGETLAVLETLGLNKISLRRIPHTQFGSYMVFGN